MYMPKIGDAVCARRKIKSKIYHNMVVGPVIDTWDNACRVITNKGEQFEGDFILYFNDWDFRFLHLTTASTGQPDKPSAS